MQGKSNELKIELFSDGQPRYDFKKEPLENIIPKGVLAYSFDKKEELAFIKHNVPVLNGFYTAHTNHYPIRIKPDDIWLFIVQAFSHHVNNNSEKLEFKEDKINVKKDSDVKEKDFVNIEKKDGIYVYTILS